MTRASTVVASETWLPQTALSLNLDSRYGLEMNVAGTAVESWWDQSATHMPFTAQSSAARRPTLFAGLANGIQAVDFDGVGNYLAAVGGPVGNGIATTTAYHLFAIWMPRQTQATTVGAEYTNPSAITWGSAQIFHGASLTNVDGGHFAAITGKVITNTPGTLIYSEQSLGAGTFSLQVGTAGTPVTAASGNVSAAAGNAYLGINYNQTAFGRMRLMRLIMYSAKQTGATLTGIRAGLNDLYGPGL